MPLSRSLSLFRSDGCGRTGAFLVIDANLEYLKEDNTFDVFGYTKQLRGGRKGMIESLVGRPRRFRSYLVRPVRLS